MGGRSLWGSAIQKFENLDGLMGADPDDMFRRATENITWTNGGELQQAISTINVLADIFCDRMVWDWKNYQK